MCVDEKCFKELASISHMCLRIILENLFVCFGNFHFIIEDFKDRGWTLLDFY